MTPRRRRRIPTHRVWLLACGAALALYALTACPVEQDQDAGWQQYRITTGHWQHPLGLALVHPLHYGLGRLALRVLPIEPAFAITLVSSLAGAIAVANLAAIVWRLTRRGTPTVVAALGLGLAHTFWQHATHTESYALVAALLTCEWLALTRWAQSRRPGYLIALALANGLGLSNHMLAALATPVDLLVILTARPARPRRYRLGAAFAWLVGAGPLLVIMGLDLAAGHSLIETVRSATVGVFAPQVLNVSLSAGAVVLALGFLAYNFPNLIVPLALAGWGSPRLPRLLAVVWTAELVLYAAFVLRYPVSDQYTFFFPVYLILAIFAGLGLDRLLRAAGRRVRSYLSVAAVATCAWNPLVYLTAWQVFRSTDRLAGVVRNKPYRDDYRLLLLPWGRGDDHARRLNEQLARRAGSTGLILVADRMQLYPVLYAKAVGRLPAGVQVRLISRHPDPPCRDAQELARHWLADRRPVLLVPYDRDRPQTCLPGAFWQRSGDVYVLLSLGEDDRPAGPAATRAAGESPPP